MGRQVTGNTPLTVHWPDRHADASKSQAAVLSDWVQLLAASHVGCDCQSRCAFEGLMQTSTIAQLARDFIDADAIILTW